MQKTRKHTAIIREKLNKGIRAGDSKQAEEAANELEAVTIDVNESEKFLNLHVLAKYYRIIKNYDLAANYSQQAIRMAKRLDKDQIEVIIAVYLNYVVLEREYGQLSNGRIQIASLLALLDKHNFQGHFSYGLIYKSLGNIEMDLENKENGLNQLEKALFHFQQAVPAAHTMVVNTINKLTEVYIQIENYHQAIKHQLHLLKIYQSEQDSIQEGQQLLTLGEIYYYVDLKKARRTITDAIPLLKEYDEGVHPDLVRANLMLGEIDEHMYHLPRATTYYKRALGQIKKVFGEDHFLAVYAYSKLGTLSIKINELKEAQAYLEHGLHLSKKHSQIRSQFLFALGKLYSGQKQYDQAFPVFQEFLKNLEQGGKVHSLAYGNTLQAMGHNELAQEKVETACVYYEQALQVYEHVPHCKEEKGLTLIRLAHCYVHDLTKSETYLERGYRILKRTSNQELLEEVLLEIIAFFTQKKNPKKQKMYEDELAKLQTSRALTP